MVKLVICQSNVLILDFCADVGFGLEIEDSLAGRGGLVHNFNLLSIKDGLALVLLVQAFLGKLFFGWERVALLGVLVLPESDSLVELIHP